MVVWTLVIILYGFSGPPVVVIDNIATKGDCERVAAVFRPDLGDARISGASTKCIAIRKAKL